MDNLLHLALSNAVAAIVLALIATVVRFFVRRRPALVHGLWLLVLIKLFTPPLVRLPAPWTVPGASGSAEPTVPPAMAEEPQEVVAVVRLEPVPQSAGPADFVGPLPEDANLPPVIPRETGERPAREPPAARPPAAATLVPAIDWFLVIGTVWVVGSISWFLLAAVRVLRFRRLLRFALLAPPELRQRSERLAQRLGLRRCPAVLLVPGRLSPMLFAAGGPARLLVPAGLLGQVRDDQLDTLLLHELAHLRRRDHWVRGLELLATGLYWWHPVVWWARHELREAEEQCCDAWVVSVLSSSRRAYAEALVETLDFLSTDGSATPLLASGIGHVSDLKRRLTMILTGTTPRGLGRRGVLMVLGLAALLPLLPAWVRAEEPGTEKKPIEVRPGWQLVTPQVVETDQARMALMELEAQLAKEKAELAVLEARLKMALDKQAKKGAGWQMAPGAGFGGEGKVIILKDTHFDFQPGQPKGTLYELVPGEKGTLILRPVAPPLTALPTAPVPPIPLNPADVRTQQLEKRLDELMKELEKVRKEFKPSGTNPFATPTPKLGRNPAQQEEETRLRLLEAQDQLERVLIELKKKDEMKKR